MDFENGAQQWALNFDDRHCYVCNQFPYVQIFYRRCKAAQEYEEITDDSEIRNLKSVYRIDEIQNSSDDTFR